MTDHSRSREVLVNILCGAMSGMRPATEREREQYQHNTQTSFDLLVVSDGKGLQDAHVARPELAGAFDFDRVKRYDKAWFDTKGRDLLNGVPLSEVYPGRSVNDPFVEKTVALLREHAPQYAGKLVLHGTAFPSMVIEMAGDYLDRATYDDKTLSIEASQNLRMFLTEMAAGSDRPAARDTLLSPTAFLSMRAALDQEFAAFEASTIQGLVEEIDLSNTPLPK
jgi:hypothetical protein